jgi:3,4-dihydroxy 2-butanone 4-phosphate synthase
LQIKAVEGMAEIRGKNGIMRSRGCLEFGKKWGIKVCTIEDLVDYVERAEAGFE